VDLSALLATDVAYNLEVTSGKYEGHRFDVVSASGNAVTLATDSDLYAAVPPFNTLTGSLPAEVPGLPGSSVIIRRHLTLNEIFPPNGFFATGSPSTADEVQLYAGGSWQVYWLYSDNGSPRWVNDAGLADRGATVIPSGQGVFFNNRSTTPVSILAYGEVRNNNFIRPLAAGSNLVGGGYPVDQSASATGGRAMSLATGFFGSQNFKTADSFYVWNPDTADGAPGYTTYYLLNISPTLNRWIKVGDGAATSRGSEILLLGNRAVFTRNKSAISGYGYSNPWTP